MRKFKGVKGNEVGSEEYKERAFTPINTVWLSTKRLCTKNYYLLLENWRLWRFISLPEESYTNYLSQWQLNLPIAIFHSGKSPNCKGHVSDEVDSVYRVVIATCALGLRINIADIRNIIHYGRASMSKRFAAQYVMD